MSTHIIGKPPAPKGGGNIRIEERGHGSGYCVSLSGAMSREDAERLAMVLEEAAGPDPVTTYGELHIGEVFAFANEPKNLLLRTDEGHVYIGCGEHYGHRPDNTPVRRVRRLGGSPRGARIRPRRYRRVAWRGRLLQRQPWTRGSTHAGFGAGGVCAASCGVLVPARPGARRGPVQAGAGPRGRWAVTAVNCDVCGSTVEFLDDCECASIQLEAIWVDGPDSEAARAARAPGSRWADEERSFWDSARAAKEVVEAWPEWKRRAAEALVTRLTEPEPDYRAMWEDARRERDAITVELASMGVRLGLAECDRDEARRLAEEFAQRLADETDEDVHLPWSCRTPDPTHTPAVRRVVASEVVASGAVMPRAQAYESAAYALLRRAWERRPTTALTHEWIWEHWPGGRIKRLAAWLRHRDEEAGYR